MAGLREKPSEAYLAHYGVLGMKWGVRKERKTDPQKAKERALKREAKAVKFDTKAQNYGLKVSQLKKELDSLPRGFGSYGKRGRLFDDKKEYTRLRDLATKDASRVRDGKLTSTQRSLVGGAIIVGTVLAVVGTATVLTGKSQSGEFNALKLKGEQILNKKETIFDLNPKLANKNFNPTEVLENVVKGANPNYAELGGQMNCRRATFAYELRRRGFNVGATPSIIGAGQTETGLRNATNTVGRNKNTYASIMDMVTGGKGLTGTPVKDTRAVGGARQIIENVNVNSLLTAVKGQPDGSRGEVLFDFGGFGHSMAYEIFNGKPVIFDPQKAAKYTVDDFGFGFLVSKWGMPKNAVTTRLDDVDLDLDFLARWAKNL